MNLVALQQPRVGHSFFGMLVQGSACGAGGLPAIALQRPVSYKPCRVNLYITQIYRDTYLRFTLPAGKTGTGDTPSLARRFG